MAEYILREQAIIAVTGAKLPDVSASGLPIANGKRSVTDCVRRLKEIPAADVRPVVKAQWINLTPPKYREAGKSIFWMCSECKSAACFMAEDLPYSYCPNCGADCRGDKDGE